MNKRIDLLHPLQRFGRFDQNTGARAFADGDHDRRQNLVFAFAYNAFGIPVAAGVLYPTLGILLSPVVAALAMSLSSVSVIGNASMSVQTRRVA
jgi:hypothetical protein